MGLGKFISITLHEYLNESNIDDLGEYINIDGKNS